MCYTSRNIIRYFSAHRVDDFKYIISVTRHEPVEPSVDHNAYNLITTSIRYNVGVSLRILSLTQLPPM